MGPFLSGIAVVLLATVTNANFGCGDGYTDCLQDCRNCEKPFFNETTREIDCPLSGWDCVQDWNDKLAPSNGSDCTSLTCTENGATLFVEKSPYKILACARKQWNYDDNCFQHTTTHAVCAKPCGRSVCQLATELNHTIGDYAATIGDGNTETRCATAFCGGNTEAILFGVGFGPHTQIQSGSLQCGGDGLWHDVDNKDKTYQQALCNYQPDCAKCGTNTTISTDIAKCTDFDRNRICVAAQVDIKTDFGTGCQAAIPTCEDAGATLYFDLEVTGGKELPYDHSLNGPNPNQFRCDGDTKKYQFKPSGGDFETIKSVACIKPK